MQAQSNPKHRMASESTEYGQETFLINKKGIQNKMSAKQANAKDYDWPRLVSTVMKRI